MTLPEHVVEEARECAKLFRLGRDIEGALKMVELIDRSLPLMDGVPAERQAEWERVLSAILACQERQDWLGVADWLEVEFLDI
ncbi:hypothetical protein [Pseudomonas petrae]|uniref:hypothetical protein n=1 Tax=Pseudomonas petrae TaxID=2912190 RepID=UPI001EF153CE|nr:hypothetical protein [Pseudomonas petrae]MCF7533877.1 hypothetical protein [Pseudomonas petrae]MCF7538424.1 hypothetical protein [Pseudomonas petrae]MCF7555789.1 hypothetical protein [Pseudomonas petrae]